MRGGEERTGPVDDPPAAVHGNPRQAHPSCVSERSAHRLYVEVAWTTVDRLPLAAPWARASIEGHLIALCRRLDVDPVAVHASASRVRLLLRFKPSQSIGAIVTSLKLGSQDAALLSGYPVRWASGFAALSLSVREVRRRAFRLRTGS